MDADPKHLRDAADPHHFRRRGVLFVLSSPSGAGKSTIARKLLADEPELGMSVSATTRPMRPGEIDGRDYHFVDLEEFRRMVADEQFLEWAHVFGHRYGTPRAQIEAMLAAGKDVLFDIDWQGAQQLFQIAGGDVVRVFIFPPSMEELHRRLTSRGTDTTEVIDARLRQGMPTVLVALHSFTPVYAGVARPWHIGTLYHRDTRLPPLLLKLLRAETDLVVGDNEPYAVSDATDYGIPVHGEARGLMNTGIEIRQDLIADPAGQQQWADRLARIFGEIETMMRTQKLFWI
jgi:guanylate kinase